MPYHDYRFWLIQFLNCASGVEIAVLPTHAGDPKALTAELQNSFGLQAFALFFIITTFASAIIFGFPTTIFTIVVVSLFLIPKLGAWATIGYDHIITARFAVIAALALLVAMLVTRERTVRLNVQELNVKMREADLEKDRYRKMANEAQENERRRISRDLHDDSLQLLATVIRQLDAAAAGNDPEASRAQMMRAKETITMTSDAIRRYCEELRPMLLESMGLIPAVEWMAQDLERITNIKVTFVGSAPEKTVSEPDLIHVYRVIQEAFNNIKKHSKATAVKVEWSATDLEFSVTITDNGIGLSSLNPASSRSLGIQGMYERAELIGGTLVIESQSRLGTRVCLTVPADIHAE